MVRILSTHILFQKRKSKSKKVKASQAETTEETSQQIVASKLTNVSEEAAVNLLSLDALKRNIYYGSEERNMLPNPQTRDEIPVLPQEY